jgi:hypothetical protein
MPFNVYMYAIGNININIYADENDNSPISYKLPSKNCEKEDPILLKLDQNVVRRVSRS